MNRIRVLLRPRYMLAIAAVLAALTAAVIRFGPAAIASVYYPDDMFIVLGFTVDITGAGSGTDVDSAWESVSGGALNIEVSDSSTGSDQFHTSTPGHKYVDPVTLSRTLGPQPVDPKGEPLAFKIDVNGCGVDRLDSVHIDDLTIDEREMTTGADWDFRVYGPGDPHYGSITIRDVRPKDDEPSCELYQWWLDTSRGQNIRKSISVSLIGRNGTTARTFSFLECYPTTYSPYVEMPGKTIEETTVRCGGLDFVSAGKSSALFDWLNATLVQSSSNRPLRRTGDTWRRTLTITELLKPGTPGNSFVYGDAFPTRYVFPSMDRGVVTCACETVVFRPARAEMK